MTSFEPDWLTEHLPPALLHSGPAGVLHWQWLGLLVVFVTAWMVGYLLSWLSCRILGRIVAHTVTHKDQEGLPRIRAPLAWAWTLGLAYLLVQGIGLREPVELFILRALRGGFLVVLFWTLARSVDIARQVIAELPGAKGHPATRSLLPLGARFGKVLVFVVAVVALLSDFGYPVGSLVAGLGLGGLAFALAAQKTIENLFGAFSIGADRLFREGDTIGVDGVTGTVEAIGLRSTRIRTADRTLVRISNGKLAEMRLESLSARDRMRLDCTLGLVYGTSSDQLREVLSGIERSLREHPKIWPDTVVVGFKAFGPSALEIEVVAWFRTTNADEFRAIRQESLLQFMEIVERVGTSFAFNPPAPPKV